jgi:hypothetical protein
MLGSGACSTVFGGTMMKRKITLRAAFKQVNSVLQTQKDTERETRIKDLNHLFIIQSYGSYFEDNKEYNEIP